MYRAVAIEPAATAMSTTVPRDQAATSPRRCSNRLVYASRKARALA